MDLVFDKKLQLLATYGSPIQLKAYGRLTSLYTASELFFNANDRSVTSGDLHGSLLVLDTEVTINFFFSFDDKNKGLTKFRQLRRAFIEGDFVMLSGDINDMANPDFCCPDYQIIGLDDMGSSRSDRKVSVVITADSDDTGTEYEVACVELIDYKWIGESIQQRFRLENSDNPQNAVVCEDLVSFIADSGLISQSSSDLALLTWLDNQAERLVLGLDQLIASFPALEDASTAKICCYFGIDETLLNADGLLSKTELNARLYLAMYTVSNV